MKFKFTFIPEGEGEEQVELSCDELSSLLKSVTEECQRQGELSSDYSIELVSDEEQEVLRYADCS